MNTLPTQISCCISLVIANAINLPDPASGNQTLIRMTLDFGNGSIPNASPPNHLLYPKQQIPIIYQRKRPTSPPTRDDTGDMIDHIEIINTDIHPNAAL